MKRFYKDVTSEKEPQGGFLILLDGKPVKTKGGKKLLCLTEALAEEIRKEWSAQTDVIIPHSMPLTQILSTRLDRVEGQRDVLNKGVLKYLDTDLICYLAAEPPELVKKQEILWTPWRVWFEKKSGVFLKTTTGLAALKQDQAAHDYACQGVESMDDEHFALLNIAVSLSGSFVLSLALTEGAAKADEVFQACYVEESLKDEIYDAEKYGPDPFLEKQRTATFRDLKAIMLYRSLL